MTNHVRVSRRLVPIEQIALIEPYSPDISAPLRSERDFKARIVLLDKDSVLSEDPPAELAKAQGFRTISPDQVSTNPQVAYWVETFEAGASFTPARPFLSRLLWRGPTGAVPSKLLLAAPETVLAVAVRGLPDPDDEQAAQHEFSLPERKRWPRRRARPAAKDPA